MSKKTVELHVRGISNSQAQAGAFALILGEGGGGSRYLPIIIGGYEAQAIAIQVRGMVPPRPMTHQLFRNVLETLGVRLLRVLIHKVEEGVFHTWIYLQTDDNVWHVDARVSDAVALALGMHAPILVYEDLLDAEGIHAEMLTRQQEDPTAETIDSLRQELQKAIDEEAYERAAELRDRIKLLTESEKPDEELN